MEKNFESKDELLKRLRRIEGQIKGIQKMVEEEQYCSDILIQVSAARAALNKVGSIILEKHSFSCIENVISAEDKEKAVTELAKTIQSFMKFSE